MLNAIIAASNRRCFAAKEKWAFAHSFLRVAPLDYYGEAMEQIRLLLKITLFWWGFQRRGRRAESVVFAGN
jgi:hypothetical protein